MKVSLQAAFLVGAAMHGRWLFHALWLALPAGWLRDAVARAEASFLRHQLALCLREGGADACSHCCAKNFAAASAAGGAAAAAEDCVADCAHAGERLSSGAAAGVGAASGDGDGSGGSGGSGGGGDSALKVAWGLLLAAMVAFFLCSTIKALAQEYATRHMLLARRGKAAAEPSGASGEAPAPVAAPAPAADAAARRRNPQLGAGAHVSSGAASPGRWR